MARINFYTSESKLRREFESYGSIKKIVMVKSPDSDKPRGYAFIEYEHERDMHCEFTKKKRKKEKTHNSKKRTEKQCWVVKISASGKKLWRLL